MSIEDPREYNRQCKIEKYESMIDRQCQSIKSYTYSYGIMLSDTDLVRVAEYENKHRVDVKEIQEQELLDCETVEDIIYCLGWLMC